MRTPGSTLPEIRLYGRPGCHLCDEARDALVTLLDARAAEAGGPVADLVEIDIESDPGLHRAFLTTIPVVEAGGRRLELATSPAKLRRLVDDALAPATTTVR